MGSDLAAGPTGDLAASTGTEYGKERVLRRLLTNPGAYLWHPSYGAGLAAFVGQPVNAARIKAVIRSQIMKEAVVARTPAPIITVTSTDTGFVYASIVYADAATGATVTLTAPAV
jgi:phage baseplate assembly protein W